MVIKIYDDIGSQVENKTLLPSEFLNSKMENEEYIKFVSKKRGLVASLLVYDWEEFLKEFKIVGAK